MKFINSSYDRNTFTSTVTMQHLGKKFVGTAHAVPQDQEKASEYAGCYYAELKATIKALKYERALAKQKSDDALDFVKSIECYSKFNKEDPSAKSMYRQLNQRIKKVNDLTDAINHLYKTLDYAIHNREVTLKVIEKKKAKQDNA